MSRKSRYRLSMVTEWRESTEPVCLGNWVSTAPRSEQALRLHGEGKRTKGLHKDERSEAGQLREQDHTGPGRSR